jgi:hypothetical protein
MTVNQKLAPCMALPEAKENWRQGIELHKRFLRAEPTGGRNEHGEPIMIPKLFVDRHCRNTIKEYQNYKMKKPSTSGLDPREGPEKKDDHSMDAIRYGLMHLFELGAKYHLIDVIDQEEINSARARVTSGAGRDQPGFTTRDFGDGKESTFTLGMEF